MDPRQVLDLLRDCEALLEGHFELSSGKHSNRYFQCARVLQYPEHAARLAHALIEKWGGEADAVVGPALGAVVWAQEVGRALGTRAMFTERKDGGMVLRRGFRLEPGERVLVVEDAITTGGSVRELIEAIRGEGVEVPAVGAIVNRSGGNPFETDGVPLVSLVDVEVEQWAPASCPLCAGGGHAVKPGSRPGTGAAIR